VNQPDLAFASATALLDLLGKGKVSSTELLEHYLTRIEQFNPTYNFVVAFDLDRARKEAAEADHRRSRGEDIGPLMGLPVTIKESFEAVGMPASCGFPALRDHYPEEDADAVARLRAAGAIIFGKTNLPQGASDWQSFNPNYGQSVNPWDQGRSPGGSSGGSAGSVASGFTAFELGSDIGGSIRIPAHFCGVFGHKPTYGTISTRGHIPPPPGVLYEGELGVAGPLARSAADLALLLPLLARPGRAEALKPARHNRLEDFRVGVWMGEGAYLLDDGYRAVLESYVADLERAGARIDRVELPVDPAESYETYMHALFAIVGAGAPGEADNFAAFVPDDPTGIAEKMVRYMRTTLPEWFAVQDRREHLFRSWTRYFEKYDALLCPAVPIVAFPHMVEGEGVHSDQLHRRIIVNGKEEPYLDFTWQGMATVANLPATVLPTGRLVDGLPAGLQIIGPLMEDFTAIRFAEFAERALGGFVPPPALFP
jgi:amidase